MADGGSATRNNVEYASRKKVALSVPCLEDEARHVRALKRNGIAVVYGPAAFQHEAGADVLICPEGKLWALACNVAQWVCLAWSKPRKLAAQPAPATC